MADISAFPSQSTLTTGDSCLVQTPNGPARRFILAADVVAGQVVVFGSTDGEVTPSVGSLTEVVAGYVDCDGEDGDEILVYLAGNIIRVTNASTSSAIDMGVWLITDDNAVKGTVSPVSLTPAGATAVQYLNVVGVALEDIAVSSSGYALLMPVPITVPNAS